MPRNPPQATKKNWLTKLQNPALALATVTEIQTFVEILTPSLEVVEDMGAEPVVEATEEARLLMGHQLVEQTIPNPPTLAITARTPALTAIK